MTTGPSTLVKCPACPTVFVRPAPVPTDPEPADLWSDGYLGQPDQSEHGASPVFKCPRCKQWHWVDGAQRLLAIPSQLRPLSIPSIPDESSLTAEELDAALLQDWEPAHEQFIRLHLLWRQNHRRRRDMAGQEVWRELMDNLERLSELVSVDQEPVLAAEIRRELGEFPAALDILNRVSPVELSAQDQRVFRKLREQASARSILPFRVSSRTQPRHPLHWRRELLGERVFRWLEEGVFLFPPVEDVFAFPSIAKERDEDPILAVGLDNIDPDWTGWAPILRDGEDRSLFRFGRVFRKGEWELYEQATPAWKQTLEWFWRQRSMNFEPDGASDPASLYYCILHQIVYGTFDPHSDEGPTLDIGSDRSEFDAFYRGFEPGNDYYRCLWDVYWSFAGEGRSLAKELHDLDLDEIRGAREKRTQQRARRREAAVSGLDYLVIGGEPRWYYGVDKTPTVEGRRFRFVAQIWLDYVDAGSSLVHLFYDRESGALVQVTEQD
jgi:hypothetical protein